MADHAPTEMRETAKRLRGDILDAVPDDNDMQHVLEVSADALDRLADQDEAALSGQVVTLTFEDGVRALAADCNMEPCDCPEHEVTPPPRGTYVTVRIDDENAPVGLWRVKVTRDVS